MARTARQQARHAAAAVPGAAARAVADTAHLGPVGDHRQPRRGPRCAAAARARRRDRQRPRAAPRVDRNPAARRTRTLPVGGPPRPVAAVARGRDAGAGEDVAAVREHACAGRTVASRAGVGVAARAGHARAAPRLAGSEAAPGVEDGLREGHVRCAVATSSLDLGVDFPAVDQVLQVGSPKGLSRLLQRAGRARHRPGEAGAIVCVPTHALELPNMLRRASPSPTAGSRHDHRHGSRWTCSRSTA